MTATLAPTVPAECTAGGRAESRPKDGVAAPPPSVQFDPGLMESVVMRALGARVVRGNGFTEPAFHAEADPLYRLQDAELRASRFRELHARWFRRGGFDRPVADALAEWPDVSRVVARVTVTGAASRAEERADLATADGVPLATRPRQFWLGISMQPARFFDRALANWLRHELWHVRDMLDPAFEYRREDLAGGAAERLPQRVIQDRYALLWSLSIDARIERTELTPLFAHAERRERLARAFPGLRSEAVSEILETIGISRAVRHPELLDLARFPQQLGSQVPGQALSRAEPLRGSPCPLCRFPTFQWAEVSTAEVKPVVNAIQAEYPDWDPQLGICGTCYDRFAIRLGVWA
jgi:hypothetical protein